MLIRHNSHFLLQHSVYCRFTNCLFRKLQNPMLARNKRALRQACGTVGRLLTRKDSSIKIGWLFSMYLGCELWVVDGLLPVDNFVLLLAHCYFIIEQKMQALRQISKISLIQPKGDWLDGQWQQSQIILIYHLNSNQSLYSHHQMTSFNVESQFLDLKKTYQHFEYPELKGLGVVDGAQGSKDQQAYEGMTQNTYLFVQQKSILIKDIENLSVYFQHKHCQPNPSVRIQSFNKFPFDKVRDRVCFIFQKYQEQPSLLDTVLQDLIKPLMVAVKSYLALLMKRQGPCTNDLHSLLEIIYQLTKVRGEKYVIQYFPHEVKDLYPALSYLVRQRLETANWESRYVILLWLGVIALVPFNLQIIDSGVISFPAEDGHTATEIVDVMIEIGKFYLRSLTKMREASALFLSKLFTRPDIQKLAALPRYINFVIERLNQGSNDPLESFFICGLFESLCNIFKLVQRSELLPLIPSVLKQLERQRETKSNSAKKQLIMKLLTRIGLTYLKPRIAVWAFKKKHQSLLNNLGGALKTKLMTNTHLAVQSKRTTGQGAKTSFESDTEYYSDVDKASLEGIIDLLIEGLSEKETNVREEASKGLGAIAGRLSQDMVMDILDYILNLPPSPQTQHAVCLTIAELIRRNLLSPQKVRELYPLMSQSLLYEKQQGGYSVGQAVRDAACYMTWSVARAYEQGGYQLGISLIIAACFDREVGCRRASSAAYQQLVGRVGDVPHGIEILTEADYFTLGPQKNAYLNVAIFIASYEQYFKPFVEHLSYQKLRHWDLQIKRIAACSLSLMTPLNPAFFGGEVLQALVNYLDSDILNVKLGTIIGLGEVLLGLRGKSHLHQMYNQMKDSVFLKSFTHNEKKLLKAGEYMQKFKQKYQKERYIDNFKYADTESVRKAVDKIRSTIKQGKIYKGKAGESFRIYVCRLLQCFSICQVPLSDQDITTFKDFIEENIKNPQEPILFAAVKCIKPFLKFYHSINDSKYIANIVHLAKTSQNYARCFTLTMSKFSKPIFTHHFNEIVSVIEHNCQIARQNNDPQKRKYAIQVIQALFEEIGFNSDQLESNIITNIFNILFKTIEDYTMDKRGDIGSIVREQSMATMIQIIRKYSEESDKKWAIKNETVAKMIGLLLQQLNQKIDRIRLLAGSLLQNYFDKYDHLFEIPQQAKLKAVFGQQNIRKLIKQSESKVDSNLQTQVIKMEMRIQQTIFSDDIDRNLIYFWNLPHNIFPVTIPLLELPEYSRYILKGVCTSAGGISQSIIKYSLQQLGNYLSYIHGQNKEDCLFDLLNQIMALMKDHYKEQRIIVPLYKTLDFLLERQDLSHWPGLRKYDTLMYYQIEKELNKTKSILKVSASTGLYVNLLGLNNQQTKPGILKAIIRILCSDLPKARKVLADKLLLFLMSQEQYTIFSEEQTESLMLLLSEYDFLEQKLQVQKIKSEIQVILQLS